MQIDIDDDALRRWFNLSPDTPAGNLRQEIERFIGRPGGADERRARRWSAGEFFGIR